MSNSKQPEKKPEQKYDPMTREDWMNVISIMRSAPLNNMAHAEAVDKLIAKVGAHGLPKV